MGLSGASGDRPYPQGLGKRPSSKWAKLGSDAESPPGKRAKTQVPGVKAANGSSPLGLHHLLLKLECLQVVLLSLNLFTCPLHHLSLFTTLLHALCACVCLAAGLSICDVKHGIKLCHSRSV